MTPKGIRLLVAGIGLLAAKTAAAQPYTITDLGTLGPASPVTASAINDKGEVVGTSAVPLGVSHPFIWIDGTMQDLGLLPGTVYGSAWALNNSGQVVGLCCSRDECRTFLWTAQGGMIALPVPVGAEPWGINSQGDIVGSWFPERFGPYHAFRYRNGAFEDLGPGQAYGMNDAGQIVGAQDGRAVLWDDQGVHALETSADCDSPSAAMAINEAGWPVGFCSWDGEFGHEFAVQWTPSGISNLGDLGSPGYSFARAVNGDLIVGVSNAPDLHQQQHGFLYDNNGPGDPIDLNGVIPPDSGWIVLRQPTRINASGQIVGVGEKPGALTRAFLLTPVQPKTTR